MILQGERDFQRYSIKPGLSRGDFTDHEIMVAARDGDRKGSGEYANMAWSGAAGARRRPAR